MAVVHRTYPIPGSGGELASAICELFRRKNACVSRADIIAWAATGELYLASFLCGLPVRMMRAEQYAIREYHVPMNIDCSDYNLLYELLAGSENAVGVCLHLPDSDGVLHDTWVGRQLIFDMFDFCRDAIG